jgi:hypothetical protein
MLVSITDLPYRVDIEVYQTRSRVTVSGLLPFDEGLKQHNYDTVTGVCHMESVNTLRILLVTGAVLAGIGALVLGQIAAGVVLIAAVIPHAWLSWYLKSRQHTPPQHTPPQHTPPQHGDQGRPDEG